MIEEIGFKFNMVFCELYAVEEGIEVVMAIEENCFCNGLCRRGLVIRLWGCCLHDHKFSTYLMWRIP